MIRVFLVDDHPMVRRGLRITLEEHGLIEVVGEAGTAAQAIAAVEGVGMDVMLLDLSLPDRSGMEVLLEMKKRRLEIAVLLYTRFPEEQYAVRAMKAGAAGFVGKGGDPGELVIAIQRVAEGGLYVTPKVGELLSLAVRKRELDMTHEDLSGREFDVFLMLVAGQSVTEISRRLELSVKTVSTHRMRIIEKLGVKNLAGLVRYAIRMRIGDD